MLDRERAYDDWSISEFCDRIDELEEIIEEAVSKSFFAADFLHEYPKAQKSLEEFAKKLATILGK
jgi:hypothetical protein